MRLLPLFVTFSIAFFSYQVGATPTDDYRSLVGATEENPRFQLAHYSTVRESAGWGDAKNEGMLGYYFYAGFVVDQDYKEAFYWFYKGAIDGDYLAQEFLGHMYENGLGTKKDYVQAYRWYNIATTHAINNDANILRAHVANLMTREQVTEAQKLTARRDVLTWISDAWTSFMHSFNE